MPKRCLIQGLNSNHQGTTNRLRGNLITGPFDHRTSRQQTKYIYLFWTCGNLDSLTQ